MSDDRPLTDAQVCALQTLDGHARAGDSWVTPRYYLTHRSHSRTTLYALERRGYVQVQERPMATVARITDAGRALLRGMGD